MKDECIVCKAPLEYLEYDEMMECVLCRKKELSKRILHNATPIKINLGEIGKLKFFIPSIPVQEHIVSILDKFDNIVNNISKGLPKEIELRQKQYEYYREKLLSFDR